MRLVVIGGVAAGLSAAARARRVSRDLEITVLEKGPLVSYGACGLPHYVSGVVPAMEQLVTYTPEYFRRERRIDVRTGAEVVRIEHPRRQVVLASGEAIRYDGLVIATGASASRQLAGSDGAQVFTINTPDDARALREFLIAKKPRRGLVIGAGYIGLEAAEALRVHGARVTVVDRSDSVLGRSDAELTRAVQRHLADFGIDLRLGEEIGSIEPSTADVVVLGMGVAPNVRLAVEAGVRTGRTGAIATDERTETNLRGVFAAGDCAETMHRVTGQPVWIPLGTTANKMGRVAGANAAGGRERFPGIIGTSIVGLCGLGVAFTGLCLKDARKHGFDPVSARIESRDRAGYMRSRPTTVELIADRRSGKLVGATVLGELEVAGRIDTIAAAITSGMSVEDFAGLDLAYAPAFAPVWDPVLIAAQQLLKQM